MNQKILHALFFCPSPEGHWGLPALFRGEPGTGKTANIKAVAKASGLFSYRISPGERGEGQFGVVPVPGADGFLHYPPPDWAHTLEENGGILFVDELNTAPPALQSALLGLVQLRTIGSFVFNKRVRVIGATNSTEDAAGGWDLPPALANRFGHYAFEGMDAPSWVEGLIGGFGSDTEAATPPDPSVEEARVMAAWPGASAAARGLIGGFIFRRPELLHKRPAQGSSHASMAWPSRRSVEYAAVALASARVHGLNEIDTDELLSGFVGQAWVTEFRVWQNLVDLPDPADLLDGKVKFTHDEHRLDRSLATLGACTALVIPDKAANRAARAAACWRLVDQISKTTADIAVPSARALCVAKIVETVVGKEWATSGKPALSRLLPLLSETFG